MTDSLPKAIARKFSLEELSDLCFEMNIEFEDLPGETRNAKARQLVAFCARHDRLTELLEKCQRLRPRSDWNAYSREPKEGGSRHADSRTSTVQKRVKGRDEYRRTYQPIETTRQFDAHISTDSSAWGLSVKDILRNWNNEELLARHPFVGLPEVRDELLNCEITPETESRQKAVALRRVVRKAIEELGVEGEAPPDEAEPEDPRWLDRRWRHYNILILSTRYAPQGIASRVGLAGGHFYREWNLALEEVGRSLHDDAVRRRWESVRPPAYPSGPIRLEDPRYIERGPDHQLSRTLGSIITVIGPRQSGKTSFLIRAINVMRSRFDSSIVFFDLQGFGPEVTQSMDRFLLTLIEWIFVELGLDGELIRRGWQLPVDPQLKLSLLMETHVLPSVSGSLVLVMDEVDRLVSSPIKSEFFSMLRAWNNRGVYSDAWDRLFVFVALSTEQFLLIDDLNQSPFNVGETLYLEDFTLDQIVELNRRYGYQAPDSEVSRMAQFLNGHPYLTNLSLYEIVAKGRTWDELEDSSAYADADGPFYQHLQQQKQLIRSQPRLHSVLKDILRTGKSQDEEVLNQLKMAGLITKDGSVYTYRCKLYERFFSENL